MYVFKIYKFNSTKTKVIINNFSLYKGVLIRGREDYFANTIVAIKSYLYYFLYLINFVVVNYLINFKVL